MTLSLFFQYIRLFPALLIYWHYDFANYIYHRLYKYFYGWGIHLFTGKFGKGKTSLMVIKAYKYCCKYPHVSILTNLKLKNFPDHTRILPLKTCDDILNAPNNTIVLIDEIGTLFNSRDFSSGKASVPKPVFQHLCQCRKRHMMIYGTVQRFNLLDKQIRDISATVTACSTHFKHPFSRLVSGITYDIDEYEAYVQNPTYIPRADSSCTYIQTNHSRELYDTSELIEGLLKMEYISDEEILRNQGEPSIFSDFSKEGRKAYKKAARRRL